MELIVSMVGPIDDVAKTIKDIQALRLPFVFKEHDGNGFVNGTKKAYVMTPVVRNLGVCYSIVFPEPCRDIFLTTILGRECSTKHHNWKHRILFWCMRKALGLQAIPDYKNDNYYALTDGEKQIPIHRKDTHFIPIGIKKDRYEGDIEMI